MKKIILREGKTMLEKNLREINKLLEKNCT